MCICVQQPTYTTSLTYAQTTTNTDNCRFRKPLTQTTNHTDNYPYKQPPTETITHTDKHLQKQSPIQTTTNTDNHSHRPYIHTKLYPQAYILPQACMRLQQLCLSSRWRDKRAGRGSPGRPVRELLLSNSRYITRDCRLK